MSEMRDFEDALAPLRRKLTALLEERDELKRLVSLKSAPAAAAEVNVAAVLKRALNNEKGWREEARRALGLYRLIKCEFCGTSFPSGGRRRVNCGQCGGGRA